MFLINNSEKREYVILLHGLCRTSRSMARLGQVLSKAGYEIYNKSYPSRKMKIEDLSEKYVGAAVKYCRERGAKTIHFVTHSMGGILVRDYLSRHQVENLGRVVMLAPPNQGSKLVDYWRKFRFFYWINGPAGGELGTEAVSTPNRLGPVSYPVGVIAGQRDGKVSVEGTKVSGMTDHVVIEARHTFIMNHSEVVSQILNFLKEGIFKK